MAFHERELALPFGQVLQPLQDEPPQPQPAVDGPFPVEIHRAHPDPQSSAVTGLPPDAPPPAFLHRHDDPAQTYVKLVTTHIDLRDGRGHVWFCLPCPRHPTGPGFVAPKPARFVAVKQLFKGVSPRVDAEVLKEISLLQELGDDIHVIRPVEVLEDEHSWYIVMPRARCTLFDVIFGNRPVEAWRVRSIARHLLNILVHLARHRVCHRDLKPHNLVVLEGGHLVAIDFGMALRVPIDARTGCRALMAPQGNFGTPAYMPPEIFFNRPYDGLFTDLWAVSLMLFNLLTRTVPFELASPADLSFRFFVMAQGLADANRNDLAVEVWNDVYPRGVDEIVAAGFNRVQHNLLVVVLAVQRLDAGTRQLFSQMLQVNPSLRLTLAQVREMLDDNTEQEIFL